MKARWHLYRARSLVWLALRHKDDLPAGARAALKNAHYALTKVIQDATP